MYNLFADKLLGLNFVSQSVSTEYLVNLNHLIYISNHLRIVQVFGTQTQGLKSQLATAPLWGLPIDSDNRPIGNTGEPPRSRS